MMGVSSSLSNSLAQSPMMVQYRKIKEQHRDALLFYQMGDFYEMFFDDAIAASEALDIALTKRSKTDAHGIPMCGVPVRSVDNYLQRLIKQGFKVAICEQTENPAEARKRGHKSVVSREVVRVMTPGTLTEDSLLDARRHNFLAAVAVVRGGWALAWTDISSGDFHCMRCSEASLGPQLARIAPGEVLVSESFESEARDFLQEMNVPITPLSPVHFDSTSGHRQLLELFKVHALDSFGEFSRPETAAMGAVVSYLQLTQKGNLPLLRPPTRERLGVAMQIDAATRRNLEISSDLSGNRANSLLGTIDCTKTAAGARLLELRISSPSTVIAEINQRQNSVQWFEIQPQTRDSVRSALSGVPDFARAMSRLSTGRGGPRDLATVRIGLEQAKMIAELLAAETPPTGIAASLPVLASQAPLGETLDRAVTAEPPIRIGDGGFVSAGYDGSLDDERLLRDEGRKVIAELQAEYVRETGIASLKVRYNNVLGYFVETPATHADRMQAEPLSATFFHRQTTANAIRFSTTRLSELASRILNADETIAEIERRIFDELSELVLDASAALSTIAGILAELDVASALAELAADRGWTRPSVDDSGVLEIIGGRHPVVEAALQLSGGQQFVANDCRLADAGESPGIRIVTGPNMAGKSTYLRQNALIVLLAQAGSFVPAASARIGLVMQLFSRVGAADELARGRSTFMVEMVETAAILNQAERKALVILDEIGRGTATYDGMSIAWATLEHLHEVNKCRTLFATHYHELTMLAERLQRVALSTVAVREWKGEVIFLHEVRDGTADRSYGIQVAGLAGIPASVVERAQQILDKLENGSDSDRSRAKSLLDDLPLFAELAKSQTAAFPPPTRNLVEDRLREVMPDELTPRLALDLVYELKDLLDQR